jgi:hypothetical protein
MPFNNDINDFLVPAQDQVVNTGQPNLEFFSDLDSLIERLSFFNIEHNNNDNIITENEKITETFKFFEDDVLDNV